MDLQPNEPTKKEVPVQKATVNRTQTATQNTAPIDFLSSGDDLLGSTQTSQPAPTQNVNNNAQAEPPKANSAFDFDFSAIQKPTTQNQTQQQPQAQPQAQPQGQFQAQQQAANMPQQAQPENNNAPDIKKLYQQSNMYNNQYAMNPMMMGNGGFNPYGNMPQQNMYQNQMYAQNNQGWNQGQMQGQNQGQGQWNAGMNMNINTGNMGNMGGNYGQFPVNNGMQQQMLQNNFNQQQAFMYAQQQQQQQMNLQMQNNGFNQGMNYAQNSPTKFF